MPSFSFLFSQLKSNWIRIQIEQSVLFSATSTSATFTLPSSSSYFCLGIGICAASWHCVYPVYPVRRVQGIYFWFYLLYQLQFQLLLLLIASDLVCAAYRVSAASCKLLFFFHFSTLIIVCFICVFLVHFQCGNWQRCVKWSACGATFNRKCAWLYACVCVCVPGECGVCVMCVPIAGKEGERGRERALGIIAQK